MGRPWKTIYKPSKKNGFSPDPRPEKKLTPSKNLKGSTWAQRLLPRLFNPLLLEWLKSLRLTAPPAQCVGGPEDHRTKGPQDRVKAICGGPFFFRGSVFCSSIIPDRMGKRRKKNSSFTLSIIVLSETKKTSGYHPLDVSQFPISYCRLGDLPPRLLWAFTSSCALVSSIRCCKACKLLMVLRRWVLTLEEGQSIAPGGSIYSSGSYHKK